ncbi:hypothetical protein SBF1_3400003 [Candidatus Desulfosporosinus infrequens]|uniref:Uncharacterized protein n=1 Tax=Candidatus Desulfosporosinus infrequens TaxID=2043169 RepID=A0A2U3L227_9FIRM|nr:hypothetical protein SBF1_3400003 [Candidatus Desulfosporosinus infrequens]
MLKEHMNSKGLCKTRTGRLRLVINMDEPDANKNRPFLHPDPVPVVYPS